MNKQNEQWVLHHHGKETLNHMFVNNNSVKTARAIESKLKLVVEPIIRTDCEKRFMFGGTGDRLYIDYGVSSKMIQSDWINLVVKCINDQLTVCVEKSDGQMRFKF